MAVAIEIYNLLATWLPLRSKITNKRKSQKKFIKSKWPFATYGARIQPSMRRNKLNIVLATAIVIALVGCENRPQVPDQIAFISQIAAFKHRSDDLNYMKITGKDEDGRLAPADISEQVNASDREILQFMKGSPQNAVQWIATAHEVHRSGAMVIINAHYGSQTYALQIFDPQAVKIAEQFMGDEDVTFSGNLGPERSITIFGALAGQEFLMYPTRLASKHGEITQAPADIAKRSD